MVAGIDKTAAEAEITDAEILDWLSQYSPQISRGKFGIWYVCRYGDNRASDGYSLREAARNAMREADNERE